MSETITAVLLHLLVTIQSGAVFFILENRMISRRAKEAGSNPTTTGDLARLVEGLNKTSNELDKILAQIVEVAYKRSSPGRGSHPTSGRGGLSGAYRDPYKRK